MTRYSVSVWLDSSKPEEKETLRLVNTLKADRAFASTIRDGLRLVTDLRAGKLDVLLELFPWVRDALATSGPPANDTGELERKLDDLRRLVEGQGIPAGPLVAQPALKGPQALNIPAMALPTFDDDDGETVVLRQSTDTSSAQNFMDSMMSLLQ